MSIFKKKVAVETEEVKELNAIIESLRQGREDADRLHDLSIADITRTHKLALEDAMRSHTVELQKQKFEAEKATQKAISDAIQSKKKLEIENGVLNKEVEILRKAFANMGFEVKDMKEILNKLVDGVVSKNTIQLVK